MNFDFLRNKAMTAVTVVLAIEIAAFYIYPTKELIPSPPPLTTFATAVGPWHMVRQSQIDKETQDLLKADDTLTRSYEGPSSVDLFVAFFKSQRGGVTPHSPKVCLPGNGWTPEPSSIVHFDIPGESKAMQANRFVVSHGEDRKLMLYWYQNPNRVTADEYLSKFYLIWDALRYHRSDEAIVRVMVDITPTTSEAAAQQQATDFIRSVYHPLKAQMWGTPVTTAALLP